uniref:Uncharacterized protein n=1 Tax=Plectus sambesii TaxID=2011161 RepID=A0A914VPM4_9BILA
MLSLWTSEDEQHRSWIAAFFANCLEDERFMEREFGALGDYQDVCLSVVNALLYAKDVQRTTNVHPENIRFCLDLLASCLYSIGSDADADHTDVDRTDDRLLLLLEILSSAAIIRPTFDELLHAGTDFAPIDRAVAVLSAVCIFRVSIAL